MSPINLRRLPPRIGLLVIVLFAAACSDPETEKVRHFERGNQYAAENRDEFAVIEYSRICVVLIWASRLSASASAARMNSGA